MRFIIFCLIQFLLFTSILSQVPKQSQTQTMIQQTTNQLNRQIIDLQNQIAKAKKNQEDAKKIESMEKKLESLKQQLAAYKNLSDIMKKAQKQIKQPIVNCPVLWTGIVRKTEIYTGITGSSEKKIDLVFNKSRPTLHRDDVTGDLDFTDDKGTGSVTMQAVNTVFGKPEICNCSGQGEAELHEVVIDEDDNTISIDAIGPPCKGGSGSDGSCGGTSNEITIFKPLGPDHNVLAGTSSSKTELGGGIGTLTIILEWNLKRDCSDWNDPYSDKRINTLEAIMKNPVYIFLRRVQNELCIKLRVAQALRTIQEQDALYAQGRSKPGIIVTNAKGGESKHNFGKAIDVYMVNCDGTIDLNNRVPDKVAKIGKEEGLEWGGDWTKKNKKGKVFKDYPHFEIK
jgi:hypothetical protein